MGTESFIKVRVDQQLKDDASSVLERMGLSLSDLLRLTMRRVIQDQALPFKVRADGPNAKTRAALEASERGEGLTVCTSVDDMFKRIGV